MDGVRALAADFGPAGDQKMGQIHHFGLAGGVAQDSFAFGQAGGHEQVLGAAHGGKVKGDVGPAQLVAAAHDVAGVELQGGAHFFQGLGVLFHGPGADGAAAGQGYLGLSQAGPKRAEHQHRGAHGLDQFVGGVGQKGARFDPDGVGVVAGKGGRATQHLEHGEGGVDVAQARHVVEGNRAVQQQGGEQDGQGGVFGAADANGSAQGGSPFDNQFFHRLLQRRGNSARRAGCRGGFVS